MSWEFFVGQKVVCVDAETTGGYHITPLAVGRVYTVRAIGKCGAGNPYKNCLQSLFLEEADNWKAGYASIRFRPIESKAISLFRSIAQGVTDGKPVVPDTDAPVEIEPVMPEFVGRPLLSWNVRGDQ